MVTVEKGSSSFQGARLGAVTLDYLDAIELDIAQGRFFTPREVQASIPVVLLGQKLVDRLFPSGNAIGQSCTVAGRTARVIGVLAQEGTSIVGEGSDDLALIPVSFGQQLLEFQGAEVEHFDPCQGGSRPRNTAGRSHRRLSAHSPLASPR